MRIGTEVTIRAPKHHVVHPGSLESIFEGHKGEIVDKEGKMFRVRLWEPVNVPGVGRVSDDLWSREWLKKSRS